MDTPVHSSRSALLALLMAAAPLSAATWTGASSANWNDAANWTDTPPDNSVAQSIVYDATSTANLAQLLNGSYLLEGILLTSPSGAVSIAAGTGINTLTIGSGGIDLSAATQNLTLSVRTTAASSQTWSVASGITLLRSGGISTFNTGTTTTFSGAGTVEFGSTQELTGAGDWVIDGATVFNNLQAGSSNNRTGSTTLNSGIIKIQTSIEFLGTGTFLINGGAIGSANGTGRILSNNLVIGGDFAIGGTGLSNGKITFSGAADLGSVTRTLTIASGVTGVFSGALSGSAGLVKSGAGNLNLDGTNSFTGATTVSQGILAISTNALSASPSVTVNANLAIGVNGTTVVNNLSGSSAGAIRTDYTSFGTSSARTLRINQSVDGTFAGGFTMGGSRPLSLIKEGAAKLTLSGGSGFNGSLAVNEGTLSLTGAVGRTPSSFTVGSGATLEINGTNVLTAGHSTAMAASRLITVDGGTLLMGTSADTRIGSVTLANGAIWTSNRALTAYDVLLANVSTGPATVSVTGNAAATMNGSGGIHLQGPQVFNVADVTSSAAADLTISMQLDGPGTAGGAAGGLTKTGAGTLVLTGSSTYSGATTVSAGVLALEGSGTIADGSGISLAAGTTFRWNRSSNDISFGNGLSGSGTFAKLGSAELGLTTGSTFSGLFDIQQGKLAFNHAGSTNGVPDVALAAGATLSLGSPFLSAEATVRNLTGAGTIDPKFGSGNGVRTLRISPDSDGEFSGDILDDGSRRLGLVVDGSATLTLSGSGSTFSGGVTLSGGGLRLGNAGALGAGALTLSGGEFDLNGNSVASDVSLSGGAVRGAGTLSGSLSGAGGLTKLGAGTLSLSGTLGFSGDLSVSEGALEIAGSSALGGGTFAGEVSIADGASLLLASSATQAFSGGLVGSGGLSKSGAGTVTFSGSGAGFTGAVTVSAGTLVVGSGDALGSGTVTVSAGVLDLNGFSLGNTLVLSGGRLTGLANVGAEQLDLSSSTPAVSGSIAGTLNLANKVVDVTGGLTATGTLKGGSATFTGGLVTLGANAVHAPGDSPGTQTFADGLAYDATSTLEWEIDIDPANWPLAEPEAGANYDFIEVTGGSLSIASGAKLEILLIDSTPVGFADAFWDEFRSFQAISYTSVEANITGIFTLDATDANLAAAGRGSWGILHDAGGVYLQWTPVPEPSTYGLLLGGLALAAAALRRRRKQS